MDDYGNLGMIMTRAWNASSVVNASVLAPYKSRFAHDAEAAVPGYYSAYLLDAHTHAEVTASGTHSAMHRYTCDFALTPTGQPAPCVLIIDVSHTTYSGLCTNGNVTVQPAPGGGMVFSGALLDAGGFASHDTTYGGVYVYFYGTVETLTANGSVTPMAWGTWANNVLQPFVGNASSSSGNVGAYVTAAGPGSVGNASVQFLVRVGISYISIADAATNLALQQGNATFDAIQASTLAIWEELLGRVTVIPADENGPASVFSARMRARQGVRASAAQRRQLAESLTTSWGKLWALRNGLFNDHPDVIELHRTPNAWAGLKLDRNIPGIMDELAARLPNPDVGRALALIEEAARAADAQSPNNTERLSIFYTSLYHSFAAPSTYSGALGTYRGFDNLVHNTWPGGRWMSDLSLWDIHRTQTQLLGWLVPDALTDIIQSLITMKQQSGILPRWPFANVITGIMDGSHAVIVMADGVLRGNLELPTPYNLSTLATVATDAVSTQDGTFQYSQLGYVPVEAFQRGASDTLEFAADDAAASLLAGLAGDSVNAAIFANRSLNYQNIWSSANNSMCPRFANGSIICPWNLAVPHPFNPWYTEGDTVEWSWFVPHDLQGLTRLFPSVASYIDTLNTFFVNEVYWPFGTVLPNPWYWAGNEPDILAPWQFGAAGDQYAYLSQYWSRWLCDTYYTTKPDGIPGNDDYGTLSAWLSWAYMGLYPVAGTKMYALGSPVFAAVNVTVPPSAGASPVPVLSIVAHNASSANVFVAAVAVNGAPFTGAYLPHDTLFPSGLWSGTPSLLEFWMTDVSPGPLPPIPSL